MKDSWFTRDGFKLRVNRTGAVHDLVEMAQFYETHNNDEFYKKYEFDWPYGLRSHEILEEFRKAKSKELGLPTYAELIAAAKRHDPLIDQTTKILEYHSHDSLPDSLKLSEADIVHLSDYLEKLVDRLVHNGHPTANEWRRPWQVAEELKKKTPKHAQDEVFFGVRMLRNALAGSKAMFEGYAESFTAANIREKVVNYNITIKDVAGPVNVLSQLEHVVQTVNTAASLDSASQHELAELFQALKQSIERTPAERAEEAVLISEQAEAIGEELQRPQPRKGALKIKAAGLVEAANALRDVVPAAIEIARKIARFVASPI